MQQLMRGFLAFKAVETDPFALKRSTAATAADVVQAFQKVQLPRDKLTPKIVLGVGLVCAARLCAPSLTLPQFGRVFAAESGIGGDVPSRVAVKIVLPTASPQDRHAILEQAALHLSLKHANVLVVR